MKRRLKRFQQFRRRHTSYNKLLNELKELRLFLRFLLEEDAPEIERVFGLPVQPDRDSADSVDFDFE